MVGLGAPDDAAVWRLDDQRALVITTDFFTPVVDDAYDYGAIAAANALSDLYAMGARPMLALNVACLPPSLPSEQMAEITRGAADKVREAGGVIAGGHTVQDDEPKVGLVAVGMADPQELISKAGARPGDLLVLTKPIGTGVIATALKAQKAAAEDVAGMTAWMKHLNRAASELAVRLGVKGGRTSRDSACWVTGWSWPKPQVSDCTSMPLPCQLSQVPEAMLNSTLFPAGRMTTVSTSALALPLHPRLMKSVGLCCLTHRPPAACF